MTQVLRCFGLSLAFACGALAAHAEDKPAAGAGLSVELNKLEAGDKGCRPSLVVKNPTDTAYQSFKLDLVIFQTDGIIGKQVALELGPVKPQKLSVKRFEIDGVACDKIGTLLINDIIDCKAEGGSAVADCMKSLVVSSLSQVKLSK